MISYLFSAILTEATTLLNIRVEQIWTIEKNIETMVRGIMAKLAPKGSVVKVTIVVTKFATASRIARVKVKVHVLAMQA